MIIFERIKEAFDATTTAFFGGVAMHFATIKIDVACSQLVGIITVVIGLGKLVEMLTGRKVNVILKSFLTKRKK